ncbi:MAG: hypothetical protein LUG83_03545 [Lachnospiraceae bacterium]|nr:hypothetical protein [Lachnospiraceae bacterium]
MKIKNQILKLLPMVAIMSLSFSLNVFAEESDFSDGVYVYQGSGYTTVASGSDELVAKIDTYYYENLSDIMYCAADDYFYKRNSSGTVISTNNYGYAVARFEYGSSVKASSGRVYGYSNAVAWSDGCSNWLYSPHYYGTPIS